MPDVLRTIAAMAAKSSSVKGTSPIGASCRAADIDAPLSLHDQRLAAVLAILKEANAQRVLDLGCGEGRLLRLLLADRAFTQITGMDVSLRALEIAAKRLRLDDLPPMQRARIELLHVPYKGSGQATTDLLGGQIPASVNVIAEPLPHHQAGKLRILAQTGAQRSSFVPDVPTFIELGYPDVTSEEWFGFYAPAKTPAAQHGASLAPRRCGAVSVPRMKQGSPEVAALRRARRSLSRLATGRQ